MTASPSRAPRCGWPWRRTARLAREYLGRLALRRHDLQAAREHFAIILGPNWTRSGLDYLALEVSWRTNSMRPV